MNGRSKDVLAGVAITVVSAVILWFASSSVDFLSTWSEQSENAASRDRVRQLETKVSRLPDPGALEEFTQELRKFTSTLNDFRSDLRSLTESQAVTAESLSKLWNRHRYVWDSMTQVCTVLDIVCATKNALWVPGDPLPAPNEFALRYAYHKTPALGAYLVKDDPGA